jgi:hypothetical protein
MGLAGWLCGSPEQLVECPPFKNWAKIKTPKRKRKKLTD